MFKLQNKSHIYGTIITVLKFVNIYKVNLTSCPTELQTN